MQGVIWSRDHDKIYFIAAEQFIGFMNVSFHELFMFDLIRPLKFMMTSYTTDQSVLIEPTLNKLNTDGAMEQSAI